MIRSAVFVATGKERLRSLGISYSALYRKVEAPPGSDFGIGLPILMEQSMRLEVKECRGLLKLNATSLLFTVGGLRDNSHAGYLNRRSMQGVDRHGRRQFEAGHYRSVRRQHSRRYHQTHRRLVDGIVSHAERGDLLVDTSNQILLLYGLRRAERPPDVTPDMAAKSISGALSLLF